MDKPRIFLGSSGKPAKLLQALTRGLEDVAHVEPWTTSFNPGTTTLDRLLELTREVDFAAFVFAQDDWTSNTPPGSESSAPGQAAPRDNVVFEAGLFGGVLGMRRTFILHAHGSKLPSDLLGLTCVRYGDAAAASEIKVVNQKLRAAIENEGRLARIEGLWWQFSLTELGPREPSAVSLLRISRDRDGALEVAGRSWREDGTLSARYWSEAVRERKEPSGVFYYHRGDPAGVRRSRRRVLHDSGGHPTGSERADLRRLLARRARGPEHPGRRGRSAARRADLGAAEALEVDHQQLSRSGLSWFHARRRHEAARLPFIRVRQPEHPCVLAREPHHRQVECGHPVAAEPRGNRYLRQAKPVAVAQRGADVRPVVDRAGGVERHGRVDHRRDAGRAHGLA